MTIYIRFAGEPVFGNQAIAGIVGPRGVNPEVRYFQEGLIDEPTVAALNEYLIAQASAASQVHAAAAAASASTALAAVLPFQSILDEGPNAIPMTGSDIAYDPSTFVPSGVQAVIGIGFASKWSGTRDELKAWIVENADDPVALAAMDDGPTLRAAMRAAIKIGYPLIINKVHLINTAERVIADGKRFEMRGHANGCLVGGPTLNDRMVWVSNTADEGNTKARALDAVVMHMHSDTELVPPGALSNGNHFNFSGFRRTIFGYNNCWSGPHYTQAGGDAHLFTTNNNALVFGNSFYGAVDLAVYGSGSFPGDNDNDSALYIANSYYGCANAWAVKRNFQNVRSIGEHFEWCFNGPGALPANGEGLGLLSGSRVTIAGPTFVNMGQRCIDPRSSTNWSVTGAIVSGSLGYRKDGTLIENAAIIGISGTTNSRFEFVADISGPTDASHAAVRISTHSGNVSTGNTVKGTVKGVYTGFFEAANCDNNDVELALDDNVALPGVPDGASTRYRYRQGGRLFERIGPYDRVPGRWPHSTNLITTSTTLSRVSVGRTMRCQPQATNINVILPADAVDGDEVSFVKVGGSGIGVVRLCYPDTSYVVARIVNIEDGVTVRFNGITNTWRIVARAMQDGLLTLYEISLANVPTPSDGAQNFFLNNGQLKAKDGAGVVRTIG